MKSKFLCFLLIAPLSVSCSSDYSPKPKGYFRIDLPEPVYHDLLRFPDFTCSISDQVRVDEVNDTVNKNKIAFNLIYPRYRAQIYCTCFRINAPDFSVFSEESRRMAYFQEQKAKGIKETAYDHPEQKVYGLVYEIDGNAASPIQFVITDSTKSFFRGALYFDTSLNRDSIAPVLAYINKDIHVMMESFQWKQ